MTEPRDEALTPLLRVGLLFIFMHLSCVHLATLKTPLNFEQRMLSEVVHKRENEAKNLVRILFLFAYARMPAWSVWLPAATGQSGVTQ